MSKMVWNYPKDIDGDITEDFMEDIIVNQGIAVRLLGAKQKYDQLRSFR